MAYLDFADGAGGTLVLDRVIDRSRAPRPDAPIAPQPIPEVRPARLTALEWSIVAIAERDRLSSLRHPGRLSMAMGTLFGNGHNPRLADPRLEALRRVAVLSWHQGYTIPPAEVRGFLAAGYTPDQYELVVDSIADARAKQAAKRFQH